MPQTFSDVACTVCGCVCDDLRVTVSRATAFRTSKARATCRAVVRVALGTTNSLRRRRSRASASTLAQAVERAAEILRDSRAPLIWGLSRSSTAGQRAAVLLAEQIGATIDTTASVCHGPSIMAIQQVGESTCSLGEVRNRADLGDVLGRRPGRKPPSTFRALQRRCHGPVRSARPRRSPRHRD